MSKNSDDNTNKGKFDLSGVFHVQDKYLTDLSNSYPNVNNAPLIANYVLDLQKKMKKTTDSYKKANTSADNVLTEQNKVIDIVEQEQERLEKKKMLIDQVDDEERRKALLTESNRLRKAAYTKILLVLIFCIVIHIVLLLIVKFAFEEPVDPSVNTIFVLLHIFNLAIWTLVAFYIYINIQSRSHINFNKLELPPPKIVDGSSTPAVDNYNNLFKDLGLCYSDSCCGESTVWDKKTGVCTTNTNKKNSKSSSSPVVESFVVNNSLNLCPKFIPGKTSEQIKTENEMAERKKAETYDPATYDPKTATREQRKMHNKANVKKSMRDIMGPTMNSIDEISNSFKNSLDQINNQKDYNDSLNEINSLGKDILEQSLPGESPPGKCYFTTMEDATEISDCKKTNRRVYYPADENDLLPLNNHYDNDVYYKGLNHSKELTDRFSNYK